MPSVSAVPSAAPSHLGTVIRCVAELFSEAGDATPIMVGEHYASDKARGVGAAPRVVFVPEPGGGKCTLAGAYETGRVAKQVHACDVIVRAAESGDDLSRLDAAYELLNRVATAIKRAGAGRVEFGAAPIGSYSSPTTVDAFGADLSFSFTYDRDISHDRAIMSVRASRTPDPTPTAYETPSNSGTLESLKTEA